MATSAQFEEIKTGLNLNPKTEDKAEDGDKQTDEQSSKIITP